MRMHNVNFFQSLFATATGKVHARTGSACVPRPRLLLMALLFAVTALLALAPVMERGEVYGQVTVTGSNDADDTYDTLKEAFDAINGTAQSGNNIVITITDNTTETATAVLNNGGWNSLVIYPTAPDLSITGNLEAPLIDLNGVSNVTIDGRVNQTGTDKSLVIENENTSFTFNSTVSTIRFINGAQGNTVRYSVIKGSAAAVNNNNFTPSDNGEFGVILFSSSTSGGNSNNTIEHNDLTNSNEERPYALIASHGTAGHANSNNTIANNHLFNFEAMRGSGAILIKEHSTGFSIQDNHFFQTDNRPYQEGNSNTAIISIFDGTNHVIENNFFGGSEPNAGGSKFIHATLGTVNGGSFRAINIESSETSGKTTIKGNSFSNFEINLGGDNQSFVRFFLNGHDVELIDNTFGSQSSTDDIIINQTNNSSTREFYMVFTLRESGAAAGSDLFENNTFGGIQVNSERGMRFRIFQFNSIAVPANAKTITVINNTIGSPTQANSISLTRTSDVQELTGIYGSVGNNNTFIIENNTIANLTSNSTNSTAQDVVVRGIAVGNTTTNAATAPHYNAEMNLEIKSNQIFNLSAKGRNSQKIQNSSFLLGGSNNLAMVGIQNHNRGSSLIENNSIYNLTLNGNDARGQMVGILVVSNLLDATDPITLNNNYIHSFSITDPDASTAAHMHGIFTNNSGAQGTTTVSNNIIRLGENQDYQLRGLEHWGQDLNVYFNTVLLEGTLPAGGTQESRAFSAEVQNFSHDRNIRNNIFDNRRSRSDGGSDHIAYFSSEASTSGTTLDYNNYFANGDGGVLARLGSSDFTTPDFQSTTWNENSISVDPQYADLTSSSAEDLTPQTLLNGVDIAGFNLDFEGETRAATPTMGALEAKCALIAVAPAVGDGTTAGTAYEIETFENLLWISEDSDRWDKFYKQTADIDASPTLNELCFGSEGWSPIGNSSTNFTGTYDGGGKTISDLFINSNTSELPVGLFGRTSSSASIQKVGLVDVSITGMGQTGGLVGRNDGTITESFVTGTVTTQASSGFTGGLVGENYGAISNSYATAAVNATNSSYDGSVAGLVGNTTAPGSVTRSYSTGTVTTAGSGSIGGLAGPGSSPPTVTHSFWDVQSSGVPIPGSNVIGIGKTTTEMQTQSTFTDAGWDFQCETTNGTANFWGIDEGEDYPVLSAFGFEQECRFVEVDGSDDEDGFYATLKAAFKAINDGTQTSSNIITITLLDDIEETDTAVLNTGAWGSITIFPGTTGLSITGDIDGPLLDFNGAGNVTIDGSVGGNGSGIGDKDLVISNTSTGGSASTIRFINGAQDNTVQYAVIEGSSTNISGGVVHVAGSTGDGNSNITITRNDLTSAGGNRPVNLIYAAGTASNPNADNVVTENHFFDFMPLAGDGYGVQLQDHNTAWKINSNSFFETSGSQTATGNGAQRFIWVESPAGSGFEIHENIIGGRNASGENRWQRLSGNEYYSWLQGITLESGTTDRSSVNGNTIQNLAWEGNEFTTANPNDYYGIRIVSGEVDVVDNEIGVNTPGSGLSQSITISGDGDNTAQVTFNGILADNTANQVTIRDSKIGKLLFVPGSRNNRNFAGIYSAAASSLIRDNEINDFEFVITGERDVDLAGIAIASTGVATVEGNTISGLGAPETFGDAISGILIHSVGNAEVSTISQNHVFGLGVTDLVTEREAGGSHFGIRVESGKVDVINNIITLTEDTPAEVAGIFDASEDDRRFLFNTVYLSGEPGEANNNSFAFRTESANGNNTIQNNIFENRRSTNGDHYAIWINHGSGSFTDLTLDFNNYRATGTGGVLGRFDGADVASLPIVAGQDANSLTRDPAFADVTSSDPLDFRPGSALPALAISGLTEDFEPETRRPVPTMGALEGIFTFAGGDGDEGSPFLIETWKQLDFVRMLPDEFYKLDADLDNNTPDYNDFASVTANDNGGWLPIGRDATPFTGSFDGNGHTISDLVISRPTENGVGLFGYARTASLSNLSLRSVTVNGGTYTGGLVGDAGTNDVNLFSTIENISVTGSITGTFDVGGIVGIMQFTEGSQLYSDATVSGQEAIGGIAGYLTRGQIVDSYSLGSVSATDKHAGGIVGRIFSAEKPTGISRSYSVAEVSSPSNQGALVGELVSGTPTYENNFWNEGLSTASSGVGNQTPDPEGITEITIPQMKDIFTFAELDGSDWDFDNVWDIQDPGSGDFFSYPYLQVFTYVEPNADPAVNPIPGLADALFAGGSGTDSSPYQVTDWEQLNRVRENLGLSYLLNNDLDASSDGYADFVKDGEVLANDEKGWEPIGTVANRFTGSFDGNSYTIHDLIIDRDEDRVGLFGYVENGSISRLRLEDVQVTGDDRVGALVGELRGSSASVEFISSTGAINGNQYVGGLVGIVEQEATISRSFSGANVTGSSDTGGIAGYLFGTLTNSYVQGGSVTGGSNTGGLVGNSFRGIIENNFAANVVTGAGADPVVGFNHINESFAFSNNFWDKDITGSESSIIGDGGEGLATLALKEPQVFTDAGWDFEADTGVWTILEPLEDDAISYPYLQGLQPASGEEPGRTFSIIVGGTVTDAGDDVMESITVRFNFVDPESDLLTATTDASGEYSIQLFEEVARIFAFDTSTDVSVADQIAGPIESATLDQDLKLEPRSLKITDDSSENIAASGHQIIPLADDAVLETEELEDLLAVGDVEVNAGTTLEWEAGTVSVDIADSETRTLTLIAGEALTFGADSKLISTGDGVLNAIFTAEEILQESDAELLLTGDLSVTIDPDKNADFDKGGINEINGTLSVALTGSGSANEIKFVSTQELTVGSVADSEGLFFATLEGDLNVTESLTGVNSITLFAGVSKDSGDITGGDVLFSPDITLTTTGSESESTVKVFSGSVAGSTRLDEVIIPDGQNYFFDRDVSDLPGLFGVRGAIMREALQGSPKQVQVVPFSETLTVTFDLPEPESFSPGVPNGIQYSLDDGATWNDRDSGSGLDTPLVIKGLPTDEEVEVKFRLTSIFTQDYPPSDEVSRFTYAGGDGSDTGSALQITRPVHLDQIRLHDRKFFVLNTDLDLDVADYNSGDGWEPVGTNAEPFEGTLDGGGFTIRNLFIDRDSEPDVGLFGVVSGSNAEIKELGLLDVNVAGRDHTGALVGRLDGGATLSAVYATGSVRGRNHAGGLIGQLNAGASLTNGYALVGVFGTDHVGGLAGSVNGAGTTIDRAYSAGRVRLTGGTSTNIGGLIGSASGSTPTVTNSFWDLTALEQSDSPGGGTGKTPAEMRVLATYDDTNTDGLDDVWDMSATSDTDETLWKLTEGISYPYFRENAQDPLPGAAVLSGVVRDLSGDPLESIDVNVRLTDNQVALPAQTSNESGAFSFTIADNVGYDLYARSETGSETDLFISGYTTYAAGDDPTSVVLTLAPRSLTIGDGTTDPSCFVDGEIFAFSDCVISVSDVRDELLAADTELVIRSSADLFLTGELTPTLTAARTLTLQAAGTIRLESSSEITASGDELTLNLQPNVDNSGTDQLLLAGDINTNGGSIELTINDTAVEIGADIDTGGGTFTASSGGSLFTTADASLSTGAGTITIDTETLDLNGDTGNGLQTTGGDITLTATNAILGGLVKTEGDSLTITPGALTIRENAVLESNGGALAITTTGATTLGTNSKISSADSEGDDGTSSLSTGSLTLSSGATIDAGTEALTLLTDNLSADAAATVTTSELLISPRTPSRNITLGGSGTSLNIPADFFSHVANGTGHVRVGANDATGNISTQAVTFPDRTTLKTDGDIIPGAVTATDHTLTIDAEGSVTQTGGLITTGQVLELRGDATFTLDHPDNAIHRLDAGSSGARIGALALLNNAELTVDAVWSSDTVDLGTVSSNLNIDGVINTTDAGSDALRIAAGRELARGATTDGNINFADPVPAITVGTNGRALFYAGSLLNSTGLEEVVTEEANRFGGTDINTDIGPGSGLNLDPDGFFALLRESEPGIPVLTALTPTANSLEIAFNAPEDDGGATIDEYQYSFDNGTTWTALAGTTSPQTITELTPGTALDAGDDYTLQLRAVNSAGPGDPTASFTRTLFAGGDGTSGDPFKVASVKQLNSVRYQPDKHFVQTDDLEFTAADFAEADGGTPEGFFYNNGALWQPIGSGTLDTGQPSAVFSGVYDADNHTIDGLRINRGSANNIGLFGVISDTDAQITSLGLTGTDITGRDYTGAVAGRIRNAAEVTQVFATGEVTGRNYVGGLAGHLDGNNSELSNSYSFAEVAGITHTGGLVGTIDGPAGTELANTYAAGPVTRRSGVATTIGGLIGSVAETPTITSSYFDAIATGRTTSAGGEAKNPVEMRTLATYDGWDIATDDSELWKISDGISYPYFRELAPADIPGSAVLSGTIVYDGSAREKSGVAIRVRFAETGSFADSFIDTTTTDGNGAWELTIADNVDYELFVRDAIGFSPDLLRIGGYLRYESGEALGDNDITLAPRTLTIGTQTTDGCLIEGNLAIAYSDCTLSAEAVKAALEDPDLESETFTFFAGGDLIYAASIETTLTKARTLEAEAGSDVLFAESSVLKASGDHPLHLNIQPDRDNSGGGKFETLATLETNGGDINLPILKLQTIILGGNIDTQGGELIAATVSGGNIRLPVDADIQTGSGEFFLINSEGSITLEANARVRTTDEDFFVATESLTLGENSRIESESADITLVIGAIVVAGSARILTTGDLFVIPWAEPGEDIEGDISLAASLGGEDVLELPTAFLAEVIGSDVSTLRIGSADHTGDIVTGSTPIRHELVLRTRGDVVFGPTRFTRDVTVQFEAADRTLSQTGPVIFQDPATLNRTALTVTGSTEEGTDATTVTLADPDNQLARVSATDLQDLTVVNSRALRLDAIAAAGAIDVRTEAGDLRIAGDITTASTGADALLLAAGTAREAGDFGGGQVRILPEEGDPTPDITIDESGRALFYSGSLQNSPELADTDLIPAGNRQFTADTDTDISASGRNLPTSGFFALLRETTAGAPVITDLIPASTELELFFTAPAESGGSDITNYQYSLDDGTTWIPFDPAVTTSPVTISSLDAGSEVTLQLRAVNLAGTGTPSDPATRSLFFAGDGDTEPFIIETAGQLDNIRFLPDRNYIMTDDIDLDVAPWDAGEGWLPIGTPESPFSGSFDGDDYAITGLMIDRSDLQHTGLFGYVDGDEAQITRLAVPKADVTGGEATGILAGTLKRGSISLSYATGTVEGADDAGGLVGYLGESATITDAYARTDVTTDPAGGNAGALVGYNDGGQISRTWAANFDAAGTGAGLVGSGVVRVHNSFWDTEALGADESRGGEGVSTREMKQLSTYNSTLTDGLDEVWDIAPQIGSAKPAGESTWIMVNGNSYPYLRDLPERDRSESGEPVVIPGFDEDLLFARTNGDWHEAATWTSFGCVPDDEAEASTTAPAADATVTVCGPYTVTVADGEAVSHTGDVTIASSATVVVATGAENNLTYDTGTLAIEAGGELSVQPGAYLQLDGDGTIGVAEDGTLRIQSGAQILETGTVNGNVLFERQVTHSDTWVALSAPVTGAQIAAPSPDENAALLSTFHTSGFAGSDDPEAPASVATVLRYDETLSGARNDRFTPPEENIMPSGEGLFAYTSPFKIVGGASETVTFPATLRVAGPLQTFTDEEFAFPLSYSGGSPDSGDDGWNMLGNPFGSALDWAEDDEWTKPDELNEFIYLYDPAEQRYLVSDNTEANDAALDFLTEPIIAPFQAFWVKADEAITEGEALEVTPGARLIDFNNDDLFKPLADGQTSSTSRESTADTVAHASGTAESDRQPSGSYLVLRLQTDEDAATSALRFGPDYQTGFSSGDAWFLAPLASQFAYVYTVKDGHATLLNSMPDQLQENIEIPVRAGGFRHGYAMDGEAVLSWDLGDRIPAGYELLLEDRHSGEFIDMTDKSEIRFEMGPGSASDSKITAPSDLQAAGTPVMRTDISDDRFRIHVETGIGTAADDPDIPAEFALFANYPNPFNPTTNIRYALPETSPVRIDVYNTLGQHVARVVNEASQSPGYHEVTLDATRLASGVYLYRITAGNFTETRKMMLIK